MLRKKTNIFKWIFLLAISRVSGSTILKFKNIDENELVSNFINFVKNDNKYKNDFNDGIESTRNHNVKDYLNRILVKRVIPHGYGIVDMEYDDKFKTLYKPLVRIHKNKPSADAFDDVKDAKYDLVVILDDNNSRNVFNPAKDDALLKPFAIDNMDIKYLSNDRDPVTFIMNGDEIFDNSKSRHINDQFEHSKVKNIHNDDSLEYWNPNEFYDLLKHKYRTQKKSKNEQISNKRKLIDIINQLRGNAALNTKSRSDDHSEKKNKVKKSAKDTPLLLNKHSRDNHQFEWFAPPGQSWPNKHVTNDILYNKLEKQNDYLKNKDEKFITNEYDFPIDLLHEIESIKEPLQAESSNNVRANLALFGPVGKLIGKQYKLEIIPDEHKDSKRILLVRVNIGANPKKRREIVKNKSKEMKLFVPRKEKIKEINEQKKNNVIGYPTSGEGPSNKYTLLQQIAQLKAHNMKNEKNKIYANKKLRMNVFDKSGEEEPELLLMQWENGAEETTANPAVGWLPNYSFWNYWTFDKTIHQDVCPGHLIQKGGVCIEPPHH